MSLFFTIFAIKIAISLWPGGVVLLKIVEQLEDPVDADVFVLSAGAVKAECGEG